jgi:hypothetical protein
MSLMMEHQCLEDIFGDLSGEVTGLVIPSSFDGRFVQSDSSGVLTLMRDSFWCGLYENTADSPDEYSLKVVSRKGSNQTYSKISANSKSIAGLVKLTVELDGDADEVLGSSQKKLTANNVISRQLNNYGRLLPWMVGEQTTLYRILCVARQWKHKELEDSVSKFTRNLVQSGSFFSLCQMLLRHQKANSLVSCPISDENIEAQISERIQEIEDYVPRVIERISRNRPKRFGEVQWLIAKQWYIEKVLNSTELSKLHCVLHEEFQKRLMPNALSINAHRPDTDQDIEAPSFQPSSSKRRKLVDGK